MPAFDPNVIYQINRWTEVFETAQSRRYESLTWVSERVSFLGTGWQRGLDDWGDKWLAVYGAWMVIVRIAAANKREFRGVLCGEKGEPFSASRIARIPGVSAAAIEECLRWAVLVGWLIPFDSKTTGSAVNQSSDSSGLSGKHTTERNGTEPNGTKPNRTERNGTKPAPGPVRSGRGLFLETLRERTKEPKTLELIAKPVEPLVDELTPAEPLQCWNSCGWSDDLVTGLRDTRKAESRVGLWNWFRRQLASPDPVVNDPSVAAAVCVMALAEQSVQRPGLNKPAAWFRARLRPSAIPAAVKELDAKCFKLAAKWIAERLVSQS